jgi:hypothetical protein
MIDYTSKRDSINKRYEFTIRDHELPERIIGEYLTDAELDMAGNHRAMVKAFLEGMCVRWYMNFREELEVVDAGEGIELIVRKKDVQDRDNSDS